MSEETEMEGEVTEAGGKTGEVAEESVFFGCFSVFFLCVSVFFCVLVFFLGVLVFFFVFSAVFCLLCLFKVHFFFGLDLVFKKCFGFELFFSDTFLFFLDGFGMAPGGCLIGSIFFRWTIGVVTNKER